jgi:hypothetical protein
MLPLLTSSQESSVAAGVDHFINPGAALAFGSALAPSDHSIDESVRSGHAGKEVGALSAFSRWKCITNHTRLCFQELEKYIRRASQSQTGVKSTSPPMAAQASYSKLMASAVSPSPPLSSPPPSLTLSLAGGGSSAYAALKAAKAGGGGQYFAPPYGHAHGHAHQPQAPHLHSSPRYSSPPPLVSALPGSDALLPSPIPVQAQPQVGHRPDAVGQRSHLYESPISSASPPAGVSVLSVVVIPVTRPLFPFPRSTATPPGPTTAAWRLRTGTATARPSPRLATPTP